MGHTNYKITDEQKEVLNQVTKELISTIEEIFVKEAWLLYPFDSDDRFDNNKFTAMVRYIGDRLASY